MIIYPPKRISRLIEALRACDVHRAPCYLYWHRDRSTMIIAHRSGSPRVPHTMSIAHWTRGATVSTAYLWCCHLRRALVGRRGGGPPGLLPGDASKGKGGARSAPPLPLLIFTITQNWDNSFAMNSSGTLISCGFAASLVY